MILVVEDEAADVTLLRMAFEQWVAPHEVDIVSDGEQALAWLRTRPSEAQWVLLDLNLPRMGGKEILAQLRKERRLDDVPVVVFSSSVNPQDMTECYELGANCYVEKPYDFAHLVDLIGRLARFLSRRPSVA